MEAWVVKTSEMLAGDNSNGRLLRSGLIAQLLERRGHRVTWWMSTFDHANRRQREPGDSSRAFGSNGIIRMISSPGYEGSISARRLLDHRIWGRRFARAIETSPAPDVILCAYPTIESASVCARYGLERGIPVVVDLRDMWPDIFLEAAPGMLRPFARAGVWSLRASARRALRQATALFGITDEFLAWGLELAGRSLKSALKHADRLEARYVAIVSDVERASLKDMTSGEQQELAPGAVIPTILRGSRL